MNFKNRKPYIDNKSQTMMWTIFALMGVIIALILVGTLSSQTAPESDSLSKGITTIIVELKASLYSEEIDPSIKNLRIDQMNNQIRDLAHGALYAFVGATLFAFLNMPLFLNWKKKVYSGLKIIIVLSLNMILTLILSFGVANLDEWHQSFVDGRGSQVIDIYHDMIGATWGIVLVLAMALVSIYRNKK